MSKLTVTLPDDLHAQIRQELEEQGITTGQFIEMVVTKYFTKDKKGATDMATRTIAFQVSEELYQRIKDYLGGNEQGTHKYVSELIGKETVETTSRSLSRGRSGSSSTSHQQAARDLMTPDEVRLLSNDKALLFVRGERPVMDWKYNLLRHPNIRFTEDGGAPPYDYTAAPDAYEDLVGDAENYELLDMDDFLPAAEQPKPMFTYPRRDAHASQQD